MNIEFANQLLEYVDKDTREHLHMENYRAALVQVLESIKFLEENKLF